ncbi:MAG TPA: alpha-mannosidase [Candidatus Acidoferrales bacterium]|nr:alpha-mannosidase [Candidatus Acidoferrales bacterium]
MRRSSRITFSLVLAMAAGLPGSRAMLAQEAAQPPSAAQQAATRLESLVAFDVPQIRYFSGDDSRAASTDFDDSAWPIWKPGTAFPGNSVWLRIRLEVPPQLHGYEIRGARLQLALEAWNADTVLTFLDGTALAEEEEGDPFLLTEHAVPGEKMLIAVHATWLEWTWTFRGAKIQVDLPPGRPDPGMLAQEFLVSEAMIQGLAPNDADRARQLDASIAAVDWSAIESGDQARFDRSLGAARTALEPLREWMQGYTIRAAGNSHIDMGWLWPSSETTMVVEHTWSSALQLMREFPGLTYTHSTAAAYEWMEEKYPALFEEIRRRVKEGRWEIVGGMWVEPDLNMPDGESLVRQLLLGKRYFQEKFGVDVRTGWNPDSFGYNWQLPQIYKKSGVDYFVTQKMAWNDTTKFPYKLFWWESPDGSRVLTYFPHDYANSINPVAMAKDLAAYVPAMKYPDMLYLFGVGDHGGGPTRTMLETAERWQKDAVYPRLAFGAAQPWFDALAKKAPSLDLPVWDGELYFQYHRGVFTTQAETKKGNRRSEELLATTEKFSSLAALAGSEYPADDLRVAWKKVLFNQFHDIAAGSGIPVLYKDAARDYAEVRRIGEEHLQSAFATIASQVNTQGAGAAVLVFNPLSWTRTDVVEAEAQLPSAAANIRVVGPTGRPVLAERLSKESAARIRLRFLAEDVPPLGYKVFRVVPAPKPPVASAILKAGPDSLENEFFRVQVDPKTGCITSLWDKESKWEAIAAGSCGNELQTFVDKPKAWDAWNIDADFENHQWHLDQADEVTLVERGPLRAVLRVRKHFQKSTFVQDITLYPHVRRVDVRMTADWHEKHILLKVAFPVAVQADTASYEIPFGSIARPTTRRTPEERAQFEVPALRWADLSDASHGLSLLNDCKYGYDGKGNVLRLSLLRSPEWPDPHADEGMHEFTYSLVPHAGGWREAGTERAGYELNSPLRAVAAQNHDGSLPSVHSFFGLEPANLLLTALKQAEDGRDLILRFYEFAGKKTAARITLPAGVAEVWDADLMEHAGEKLPTDGKTVAVAVSPYEIKTLRLRLRAPTEPHSAPAK